MTETEAIKTLIDLGGQAILLFLLWKVWERLTDVTDRLIDLVREVRAQSEAYGAGVPSPTTNHTSARE